MQTWPKKAKRLIGGLKIQELSDQVKSLAEKDKLLERTQRQVNELNAKLQAAGAEAKLIESEILRKRRMNFLFSDLLLNCRITCFYYLLQHLWF
jgi:uncharacterized coiled-coil protein SlyX